MKLGWFSLYNLVLGLWVGGTALFTFVMTPVIFRSYGRDMAGEIVGKLFPGYFLFTLVISVFAFILFFPAADDRSLPAARLSLMLLTAALCINTYVSFKLYPDVVKIKQQISSFEHEAADSPGRKQFSRLHAVSASLNLLVLLDGVVLLVIGPALKR